MCVKPPVEFEIYKGIHVHRKYITLAEKDECGALKAPFLFQLLEAVRPRNPESDSFHAIHVHDLPLGQVGYEAKQKYNINTFWTCMSTCTYLLEASPHTHTSSAGC